MGRALGQGRYGNVLLRAMLHGAGRARQGYQLTDLEQLMAGAHLPADMRTPRRRGKRRGVRVRSQSCRANAEGRPTLRWSVDDPARTIVR